MAKYIDAVKYKLSLLKKIDDFDMKQTLATSIMAETLRSIVIELDYLPAADVEEVRHGTWKWSGVCRRRKDDLRRDNFECSRCKRIAFQKANFCPNCGAKMDLTE